MSRNEPSVAVIGGGPAGLMAAEVLSEAGHIVDLFDAMPSLGRKFLMAGKSGLNLTHAEPFETFLPRFSPAEPRLHRILEAFPPDAVRAWAEALGIATFIGSSGRVFPKEMKAAPLLRAWLRRLREHGLRTHVRHRWSGWDHDGRLIFATPKGTVTASPGATVLALGGASWPRLGSDGAWSGWLTDRGVDTALFRPSNCGFEVAWSTHLRDRFEGEPLKGIALRFDGVEARGDCVITAAGIEGGPVYTLSAAIVGALARDRSASLALDLVPDIDLDALTKRLSKPRGTSSLANHLRKTAGLTGSKAGLLFEDAAYRNCDDPAILAGRIKSLPLKLERPFPITDAISTVGGLKWDAVSDGLELRTLPGVYAAGEMLDWDAPTGGYLLTGCFATGRWAGNAVARHLKTTSK